ncbi:DUF296 domain-containing protein [Jannaschia sp. Os4]|uniref:PPC domain-containing DNA-binding protein n=1 Tax=Jannaschia sp. Os4 TaxID=2807617 RepID=UPI00193A5393|nr:PPC domain-containing DNA-binding protein [Jannaschia sp. Os4]MBM2577720.1 DUF296 domain-containing protein [Jannaschia sp. Os4]
MHVSAARHAVHRLRPGEDLIEGLRAMRDGLGAPAVVVTCVGSLSRVHLRHAGAEEATRHGGPLEIVGLVGTLDPERHHLHCVVSDADGRVRGGHLMPDAPVRTTAEVVLAALDDVRFARAPCPLSGYDELVVTDA